MVDSAETSDSCQNGVVGYRDCDQLQACDTCLCPARANYGVEGRGKRRDWRDYGVVWGNPGVGVEEGDT